MPRILLFAGWLLWGLALPVAAEPLIILQDRGGLLRERSDEIRQIAAAHRRVELRGECYSACTMYLGTPEVCVDPAAVFGFHGPSWYGQQLPARDFDYWSHLLARQYREPLRSWFLQIARYRLDAYYQLSGTMLIQMGYPRCDEEPGPVGTDRARLVLP